MNSKDDYETLVHESPFKVNIFRCPDLRYQVPVMVLLTLVFVPLLFELEIEGMIRSTSIFLIPTLSAAFILPNLDWYQEAMNYRQSSLMALLSLSSLLFLIPLFKGIGPSTRLALVVSYTIPLSLRYLVIRATFLSNPFKSIPQTVLQSIAALPFIHIFYPLGHIDIVIFLLASLIGLTSIDAFIEALNRPFQEDFGVSAMDMIRISFEAYKGEDEGEEELEEVFKKTAIKAEIGYTVFSFKSRKGEKALFVIPTLHPGPVKGIAGSKLPEIMTDELQDEHGLVFTFHGPSTHVQNPIKQEDCRLLSEDIKSNWKDIEYEKGGTAFKTSHKSVLVGGQILGDSLFTTASFSPKPTEDIDAPVGEIIELNASEDGFSTVGFVDAHNCVKKRAMEVYYPSRRYQMIIDRMDEMIEELDDEEVYPLKMGVAYRGGYDKMGGIAREGIKVAVFDVGGIKNAFVLIDGNNMVRGLREDIQEEIADLVDISEVMTTDSHEVNTLTDDYNPVGYNMDRNEIIEDVREAVKEASKDIEPVRTGTMSNKLKNFSIMGPIGSHRMNAVAETVYRVAPIIVGLSFTLQAVLTLLILTLV